ncbi:restriction endonuclease subunit S [Cellulomonas sp. CW35]|uniref:restriction endonuclease subunit S n=1 Tax=Cellulomonas sp. CW35 TaxID=3458249 RepID=UPI00403450D7
MTELPAGWADASLAEIGELGNGFRDGDWVESKDQDPTGEVRLLQLADVGTGTFRDRSDRWMRPDQVDAVSGEALREGDVLIARMPDPIGRSCVMPSLPYTSLTCVDVAVLSPPSEVLPAWVAWHMNAPSTHREVAALASGSTRLRISRKNLGTIRLGVPPLAEQRRIVETLDQAMSVLSTARSALAATRKRIDVLELALVRAALGDAGVSGADWKQLGQIAQVQLGRQRSPKVHTGENMVRYLRAANATWAGVDVSDVKEMNFSEDEVTTYKLADGDVLLNEASGSPREVGKPVIWRSELAGDVCFQNTLIRVRAGTTVLPGFLHLLLREAALAGLWAAESRGVGIAHIGAKRLKEFDVPVPPLEVQQRCVSLFEETARLRARLRDSAAHVATLIEATERALLESAVSGALVPQDPDDEPASALFDRLKAERASAAKQPGRRTVRGRAASAAADGGRKSA